VLANDFAIDLSGTATITFLTLLDFNFSKAMYIKALDLPDAGGAFINRYFWPL
jgi:hypothetical protein